MYVKKPPAYNIVSHQLSSSRNSSEPYVEPNNYIIGALVQNFNYHKADNAAD